MLSYYIALRYHLHQNTNIFDISLNQALEKHIAELQKKNFEVTRAYNSLAEMGKFAEEQGIDIKKHTKELPENNKYKDFKFSQKHVVLESGKVRSTYKLTPPEKTTKKKEEDKRSLRQTPLRWKRLKV